MQTQPVLYSLRDHILKNKIWQKVIAWFLALVLVFTSANPLLLLAYAEDVNTTEELSTQIASEPWARNEDGSYTTSTTVTLNTEYKSPFDNKLSIVFTKLPENPGTITVKEIKLTREEQENLGAFSDTAYDITSTMEDGTFEYDLTLPIPDSARDKDIEVKAAENVDQLDEVGSVSKNKQTENDVIKISGLNHFTVFVLVNNVVGNDATNGTFDDVANGQITAIKDAWTNESSATQNNGDTVSLSVRSQNSNRNQRALIQFDLGTISTASAITKATLRLYMSAAPSTNRTYELYRIANADWVEGDGGTNNSPSGEVRWNNQPDISGITSSSSAQTGTTDGVWLEFDVSDDIEAFLGGTPNYGWVINDSAESESGTAITGAFRSRESGTENQRPQLIVDFAPATQSNNYSSPTAQQADTGGDNNGFELNPTNAFTDGDGFASNMNGNGDRHIFSDYNFDIPAGAAINGIEARADWYIDSTTGVSSLDIALSWDGGTTWTDAKTDITETLDEHVSSFGGSSDTWNRSWSAEDFTNANFRVRVTSTSDNANRDFFLDWIPVRVYFTPDTTAPETAIDSGPTDNVSAVSASFEFSANETSTFECKIDNESYSACSSPIDYSDLTEGSHTFMVKATDLAGITDATPAERSWNIDTTAPVISVLGDDPLTIEINSVYTEPGATAADNYDGDISDQISVDDSELDIAAVDTYTIYYDVTDSSGNSAEQRTRTVSVIDSVANTFTEISNTLDDQAISNNLNSVDSNNVNNFSGLYFEKYDENGDALGKITFSNALDLTDGTTTDFLQNLGNKLDMNQGRIALDVRDSAMFGATGATLEVYNLPEVTQSNIIVRDDLGNTLDPTDIIGNFGYDPDTLTATFDAAHFTQFDFDTTAPVTTDDADGNWRNTDQTITLSCNDDLSGCTQTYYTTDGSDPVTSETRQEGTSIFLSDEGSYVISYYSIDGIGNTENVQTKTINIDKYAPTGLENPISNLISPINQNILGWSWIEATDLISGVGNYLWSLLLDSSEVLSGSEINSTLSINTDVASFADGIFTFKVKVGDNADNFTDWLLSDPLTVDRTTPDAPVITTPAQTINDNTLNIVGTAEADSTITIAGGASTATGSAVGGHYDISVTLTPNAINNLSITAEDAAGNESPSSTVAITHDDIAPTVNKLGDGSSDVILLSPGNINLVFSEVLSSNSKTAVQNALTAGTDKTLTYSWSGETLIITTTEAPTFPNDVVVSVSDNAGNSAELLLVDSKLEATQTSLDDSGTATTSATASQVVITNPTQAATITIVSGTSNPTIDVSSFIAGGTGTIPQITINSDNATVVIPASTTVTSADSDWDGIIAAPTVTTVTLPETSGETKTLSNAIEVGFASAKLSFDNAVRIVFPGEAGKRIGYSRPGISFTEITGVCSADSQATGNGLAADEDCKINVGSDLIIWTKHFTKFATYTQTANPSSNNSGSSSSSGGGVSDGLSDGLGCASHDCSTSAAISQVLGISTGPVDAGLNFISNIERTVLGTADSNELEINVTPAQETEEVLGTEAPVVKSQNSALIRIILGTLIVLFIIGFLGYLFLRARKRIRL